MEYHLNMNLIEFFNTPAFQKDKQEDSEFINKMLRARQQKKQTLYY